MKAIWKLPTFRDGNNKFVQGETYEVTEKQIAQFSGFEIIKDKKQTGDKDGDSKQQ